MSASEKGNENPSKGYVNDGSQSSKKSPLLLPLSEVERRKNQLLDADFRVGFQVASEINDHMGDLYKNTAAFQSLLSLIPIFLSVLSRRSRPNPNIESIESKYRRIILDILAKLPHNDLLRPHVSHILITVMDILKNDYEGNGIVASRIVFDLHKNYRPNLADFVQSFLDFMANCYRMLPTNAIRNFDFTLNTAKASHIPQSPHSLAPGMTNIPAPAGMTTIRTTGTKELYRSLQSTSADTTMVTKDAAVSEKVAAKQAAVPPINSVKHPIKTNEPVRDTQQANYFGNPSVTFEKAPINPFSTVSASPMPISTISQPSMSISAHSSARFSSTIDQLSADTSKINTNPTPHFDGTANQTSSSIKSSASFLVLAECPLIAILMFQHYAKVVPANLSTLLPLMVDGLAIRPPALTVPALSKSADHLTQQQQMHKVRTRELVACQVKTLSFLIYLLRGFMDQLKRYEDRICTNVVSLLTTCPIDAIGTRRELLIAVRHILATSFRKGFYKNIDTLLDDRVLAGGRFSIMHRKNNISEYYATILSPLNYSTLADLVHHVRSRLTLHQHARVIHIFSRVIHDASLPVMIQTVAVRLLLNLVDFIFHSKETNSNILGRDLLVRIIYTLVMKLGTLREYILIVAKKQAVEVGNGNNEEGQGCADSHPESDSASVFLTTEEQLLRQGKHYPSSIVMSSGGGVGGGLICGIGGGNPEHKDSIADIHALVTPLLVGIKSVIWCINNYQTLPSNRQLKPNLAHDEAQDLASAKNGDDSKLRITKEERETLSKCVKWGLQCLRNLKSSSMILDIAHTRGTTTQTLKNATSFTKPSEIKSEHKQGFEEYREILDKFAGSLSILDGYNLCLLIAPLLPFIIDCAVSDKDILVFFRHFFLSSKATSYHICEIVLQHLVIKIRNISQPLKMSSQRRKQEKNIKELGETDSAETDSVESVTLALFKLVFQSVSVYSENEAVLRPQLQKIITLSLKFAGQSMDWPGFHYVLLRLLFRTISAGKFEQSYKEILPLLPATLNGLYRIHRFTENERLRSTVAELCLTIPARLSSLLPHIPLLLRIIVYALRSSNSDLVNLGLRTLDFWVDNLNPDFFFPMLSHSSPLLTELMTSLSNHLIPAPYPHGLLTLRILGKLGGKNRSFFREPTNVTCGSHSKVSTPVLNLLCQWTTCKSLTDGLNLPDVEHRDSSHTIASTDKDLCQFTLPLDVPVYTAIAILRRSRTHLSEKISGDETSCSDHRIKVDKAFSQCEIDENKIEFVDLLEVSSSVISATEKQLAHSAFVLLRSVFASMMEFTVFNAVDSGKSQSSPSNCYPVHDFATAGILLGNIVKGLFYATLMEQLKDEAMTLIKGLALHMILTICRNVDCVERVDANGRVLTEKAAADSSKIPSAKDMHGKDVGPSPRETATATATVKLGPLEPLGSFRCVGRLKNVIDPFMICNSLVAVLCEENCDLHATALQLMDYIIEMLHNVSKQTSMETSTFFNDPGAGALIVENLLCLLCQCCFSKPWNLRLGPFAAISRLCHTMGRVWANTFQDCIMHAALFSLKDSPREIPSASRLSLGFCINMFTLLYGAPVSSDNSIDVIIKDTLTVCDNFEMATQGNKDSYYSAPAKASGLKVASEDILLATSSAAMSQSVLSMLVIELNSAKNILRFASRHCLQQYALVNGCCLEDLLIKSVPFFRKAFFSRSLRTLPLKEQVAVTQALAFIIDCAPSLFPLMDQDVLALLSELLKMTAIADGVMAAKEGENFPLVDKDGCVSGHNITEAKNPISKHNSAMFFAESYTLLPSETGGLQVDVPPDLPDGVQLRVTSLMLFRAVIRRHTDLFFDAPSTDAVGNIRPHVISLFFRSLVSEPVQAVAASHLALKDVLALGINNTANYQDSQQAKSLTHRLPKELLQTCIRPVLLSLRDHTKLTHPLLRGLSRLLSLLATWFNKTLGEKLLEHLRRWENVDKLTGMESWMAGEEPLIPASIISVFELLPQASIFAEALVTTVVKLEVALRHRPSSSPYRDPLVRYFNRYPSAAADYFLAGSSLTDPNISEIFQSILLRDDAVALRHHISGQECTRKILSLCFEKPLAIIRSEKSSSASKITRSADEILSQHGIPKTKTGTGKKENLSSFEAESSQRKLVTEKKSKEKIQAVSEKGKLGISADSQTAAESVKKQHQARQNCEKAQKEASLAQKANANETEKSKPYAAVASSGNAVLMAARMTEDALELQHQGFKIISALMKHDSSYLKEPYHADIVRTFRWLWHSKGRHLRLLHEELLPAKYQIESKSIAAVLIHYAKLRPSDADILFDLLRIFLEQTSVDFSDVRRFLENMVTNVLTSEDKKRVLHRFFSILESDRPEETKVLSIHYLVFPMLHAYFTVNAEKTDPTPPGGIGCSTMPTCCDVVDKELMSRLVSEAIVQGNKCGERLQIELLRLLTLLIKYRYTELNDQSNQLLEFIWEKANNEETSSKQWAHVNVCIFISKFETPSKLALQVYFGLLKSYQQESKDLIKEALGALIPSLPARLSEQEFDKCMRDTAKIIIEEGHGTPQLAHMLQIVVHNPDVFFDHRKYFLHCIINSLNRLGLTPNCSIESRALSLSLCDLLLKWEKRSQVCKADSIPYDRCDINTADGYKLALASSFAPPEAKKLKLGDDAMSEGDPMKNMKNEVVNFLVRIALLVVDAKEKLNLTLRDRSFTILENAFQAWGVEIDLDMGPFEDLFALCAKDTSCTFLLNEQNQSSSEGVKSHSFVKNEKVGASGESGAVSADESNMNSDKEDRSKVSEHYLQAFLQISTMVIQTINCGHNFLYKASGRVDGVLTSSFNYAIQEDSELIRLRLERFLIALFSLEDLYPVPIISHAKSLMANALVYSAQRMLASIESSQLCVSSSPPASQQQKVSTTVPRLNFSGLFLLKAIDEMYQRGKYGIVESLTGVLIKVTRILSHSEVISVVNNDKTTNTFATPLIGIIEESCIQKDSFDQRKKERETPHQDSACGNSVAALIICIRLLAKSSIPNTFSQKRRIFFSILGKILDGSNNILILISCVAVIRSWITDKCSCPMTSKEIFSFIGKMTQLDSRGLSDSAAQPLYELVASTVLLLYRRQRSSLKTGSCGNSILAEEKSTSLGHDKSTTNIDIDYRDLSREYLIGRALIAILMCATSKIRFSTMLLFCTQSNISFNEVEEPCSLFQGTHSDDPFEFRGVYTRSPVEVLLQLLSSDWEGLGSRYWIAVFVDLLIAISDHSGGVHLASCSIGDRTNLTPVDIAMGQEQFTEQNCFSCSRKTDSVEDSSKSACLALSATTLDPLFKDFEELVAGIQSDAGSGRGRCLLALRELAYCDVSLCHNLFQSLVCSAWMRCGNAYTKRSLVPAMELLLSRPYHSQFLQVGKFLTNADNWVPSDCPYSTNCVKAFLAGVACLRPIPYMDINLLLSLAANFNAWHEVIFLLENYHTESGSQSYDFKLRLLSSLQICYSRLGEDDLCLHVAMKSASHPSTVRALTLETYGRVEAALSLYEVLADQEVDSSILALPARELSLWEERWIELNRDLCRQDVLKEHGTVKNSERLLMECSWKSRDWEALRRLCFTPSNLAYLELGEPLLKIYEIYLIIAEEKLDAVEDLYVQAGQLCLYRWQLLPNIASSCGSKELLLQVFHRLIEIHESTKMLMEAESYSKNGTLPDFKNLLTAWRERTPNEYDSLTVWEDLFTWRSHIFSAVSSKFHWSDDGTLAALHDRPWTSIQIARVARKQGKKDVALMSLSQLTDCAMDVNDAFSKLREQIMLYLHSKLSDELCGGLNLVNTTNLSFFDQAQKSELFRLKASFLNSLGARAKSNQAYCQSLQICPSHAKSWLSWGHLCFNLAELTERQDTSTPAPGGDTSKTLTVDKKAIQYYSQSMGCYFEAIRCGSHNWALINIPRCLWLLRKDARSPGLLCQTFEMRSKLLPEWVWLPWIPQLLSSLGRTEAATISKILRSVLARYPQGLYFGLRAYYLERRDIERVHKFAGSPAYQYVPSVSHAEDLMSSLRRAQPQLWSSLEAVLEELIIRFRPSLEEELLSTVNALLLRGFNQLESTKGNVPLHNEKTDDRGGEVANFLKTLEKIAAKFFRSPVSDGSEGAEVTCGRAKAVEFAARYRASFERDFMLNESTTSRHLQMPEEGDMLDSSVPLTLELIVGRLRKWQRILEHSITGVPSIVPLQQLSPILASFSSEPPDMWEGACDPRGLNECSKNIDDAVPPNSPSTSAVAASAAASAASSSVAAQAAAEGVGGYFGSGATSVEIPGQYAPYSTNAFDSRPLPELNAKLIRFEPTVEILKITDDRQLVRRITMIGSDGKKYHFLLQFNGSYYTRVDEHCAQLHYLTEKVLRNGLLSSKKHLGIKSNVVIPIAQRLRLIADDIGNFSLSSVITSDLFYRGLPCDAVQIFFKDESARRRKEKIHANVEKNQAGVAASLDTEKDGLAVESNVNLDVYHVICDEMVKDNILSHYVFNACHSMESVYAFRKRFALELAIESLLQYAFNVVDRTPSRLVINIGTGQVIPTEFRISYNNQGLVEGNKLPFRMTRNIEKLIGPFMIGGIFVPTMASAAEAFNSFDEALHPALCVILRDDIVSWYCSKSPPRSDTKNQELERQLGERILKNASLAQRRFLECAPDKSIDKDQQDVADAHLRKLLHVATSPENLCQAPLPFQPWF